MTASMDPFYINGYIKLVWIVISRTRRQHHNSSISQPPPHKLFSQFNAKYGRFLHQLIQNAQLSTTNLMISLYYLYKHYLNTILDQQETIQYSLSKDGTGEEIGNSFEQVIDPMVIYTILSSLVLSNKTLDDQSYTLKTWWIIIDNTNRQLPTSTVSLDLKLLNTMESFFLASLNYQLNYIKMATDWQFWQMIEQDKLFRFNKTILNRFKLIMSLDDELPQLQEQQLQSNACTGPCCMNNYFINTPVLSPITLTFSSPIELPLTPQTPGDYYKRRRLDIKPLPPQQQQSIQQQQQPVQSLPIQHEFPQQFEELVVLPSQSFATPCPPMTFMASCQLAPTTMTSVPMTSMNPVYAQPSSTLFSSQGLFPQYYEWPAYQPQQVKPFYNNTSSIIPLQIAVNPYTNQNYVSYW